jgi:hypothetical protein
VGVKEVADVITEEEDGPSTNENSIIGQPGTLLATLLSLNFKGELFMYRNTCRSFVCEKLKAVRSKAAWLHSTLIVIEADSISFSTWFPKVPVPVPEYILILILRVWVNLPTAVLTGIYNAPVVGFIVITIPVEVVSSTIYSNILGLVYVKQSAWATILNQSPISPTSVLKEGLELSISLVYE